jgi:hypothetical protein
VCACPDPPRAAELILFRETWARIILHDWATRGAIFGIPFRPGSNGAGVIAARNGYSKVEIRLGIVDNHPLQNIESTRYKDFKSLKKKILIAPMMDWTDEFGIAG